MNKKTMQRAFDLALTTIRKQGRTSVNSIAGGCAYRGDNGCKCSIGALIEDKHYDSGIEGQSVECDQVLRALHRSGWPVRDQTHKDFYLRLQDAHDTAAIVLGRDSVREFEKNMAAIAQDYGLAMGGK